MTVSWNFGRLVVILLLTLMAVQPFFRGQMPLSADGTLHLYRLVSYDHALSDGALWPRYAAGMAFGYGAPLFNYYSPLSLVPLQIFHVLGLSFLQAWLAGMIFYTFLAGVGAYLLGRVWGGEIAGLVTAAAYVYAPYTLFDSIWRGTVSELASLALLPFVLWALWRLAYQARRVDFLLVGLSFALFIPMHNVITLHGGALIGVYTLYLWWTTSDKIRSGFRLGTALILGLMMAAFFWLPAITETDYVKINSITANLPEIDVTRNLMMLGDVFEPPITADPTQLQPPVPIALSWVQILLALPAIFTLFNSSVSLRLRGFILVMMLLLAVFIFMNLHASAWVWNVVPLIRYSQFPWRLVGLASLLLAMLAGLGVSILSSRIQTTRGRTVLLAGALVVVMVYAMPWIYSIPLPDVNPQTIIDAQNFEREEGFIATSSFGEYIPRWNTELPDANRLAPRFAENETIPRLEAPPGVTVSNSEWGNTSGRLQLNAETETALVFDWFYFPGWWAALNGEPLEITPTEPEGLVQVTVPAGEHTLEIALGLTSRQEVATVISLVGFAGLIVGTFLIQRMTGTNQFQANQSGTQSLINSSLRFPPSLSASLGRRLGGGIFILTTAIIGITLFAAKTLIIDRIESPIKQERFAHGVESGVQVPVMANFNREITLLGYDLRQSQIKSGQEIALNLYWQPQTTTENDYSSVVTLRDASGNRVNEVIAWQPAGLSTSHWMPGYYLREQVKMLIPPATPPGEYTLEASLYFPPENRSLDVINAQDNPEDVKVRLGMVRVERPDAPMSLETPVEGLQFINTEGLPQTAAVGEEFTLSWLWAAQDQLTNDVEVKLVWKQNGEDVAALPGIPPVSGFPTSHWQAEDVWRGLHRLYVPGVLETGEYTVEAETGVETIPLGVMAVTAPDRVFEMPEMQHTSGATWQNGIQLLGYDLHTDNITLYWQTDQPLYQNLRVFVHIVDSEGQIVNQRDRIPADWSRPTTGWAAGEIITDLYDLQKGDIIRIGWYDPITGERVLLTDESDTLELK